MTHLAILLLVFASLLPSVLSTTATNAELDAKFLSYELTHVDLSILGPVAGNLEITFSAYGQKYNLKLHKAIKKPIHVIISSRYGQSSLDLEPGYYTGRITGKLTSFAHGTLEDAAFSGSVYVTGRGNDDVIYVEPLCRFLKTVNCSSTNSVVYRRSDVRIDNDLKNSMQYKRTPAAANTFKGMNNQKHRPRRQKRALPGGTICQVFITIDHTFYQQYANSNPSLALSETCYFLMEAGKAFEDTDFDGNGSADKIGFDMRGLHIFETADAPQYKMSGNLDADQYLDLFSEYDFDDYCLAAAFAHRDFPGGVLGLAWIASTTAANKAGGICQARLPFNPPMSYNTLLVTSLNYGSTQSKGIISLTLTHEFGHSFGSDHDDQNSATCSPSNANGGKYVMHPFSTDTNRPNNWLFSPCSRNQINPVLMDKAGCFAAQKEPFCGDGLIDAGEDCDCGPTETCDQVDPCCVANQCTFKSGKTCTPLDVTKPCCSQDCLAASTSLMCRLGGECKEDTYCDGSGAVCPNSVFKSDGTFCYGSTAVCDSGSCSKSVCSFLGLEECQCLNELDLCFVCCKNSDGDCVSVERADPNQNAVNSSIPNVPGQSCNDYKGFCDDSGQCRKTGKKGARDRLNKFLRGDMWTRWFANYGLYIGLNVALLVIVGIVLKTVYKKKQLSKSPAHNMAKVALLWKEANAHYQELANRLETLHKEYREFIEDEFVFSYNSMTDTQINVSIVKLSILFSNVPENVIRKRVEKSHTEEQVVEKLIKDGHEMKKILS